MRIIIGQFKHETNSLSPTPTTDESYRKSISVWGKEVFPYFSGTQSEIGGFLDAFAGQDDFELIPTCALEATPAGPGTMDVYENVKNCILNTIRENKPVDGVLLSLHGAMILQESEDGEGDLLSEIRKEVGADVPIMASLDLHANITKKMMENCNAFFGYDYYPHTDKWFAGNDAAKCMIRTLRGEIKPVMRYVKLPFLCPYLQTSIPMVASLVDKEHEYEKQPGVLGVNIYFGFFSGDIYEGGVSVIAVTDGDENVAQKIADELSGDIWSQRATLKKPFYTVDEAVELAKGFKDAPVVFADVADNPGAGGSCDGTFILRRMIELGVKDAAFATILDPEVVKLAEATGIGNEIDVELGGKTCPEVAGDPIKVHAKVVTLTDAKYVDHFGTNKGLTKVIGKTAVLDVSGILVIVNSINVQSSASEVFECCGINPLYMKILVVKSTIHYRASFGRFTDHLLDVQVPGLCPQHPSMVRYKNCRRPIYPLDEI